MVADGAGAQQLEGAIMVDIPVAAANSLTRSFLSHDHSFPRPPPCNRNCALSCDDMW